MYLESDRVSQAKSHEGVERNKRVSETTTYTCIEKVRKYQKPRPKKGWGETREFQEQCPVHVLEKRGCQKPRPMEG